MKLVALGPLAGLALALCSAQVAAQPLAEIARQEKLRREALAAKAVAESGPPKVYTNADLRSGGRLTTGNPVTTAPAPGATGAATTPTAEGAPETPVATMSEDQWRNRITAARQAQQRAQLMAEALQNRVDGLWTDFASRDDPAQRAVIEESRQVALAELESTGAEVEALTQQIADIQEEARRASVPPGWLR